jgi:diguanylate cyclase (GGDEF)-like protein/PAS domain S-box-containing protein
MSVIGWVATTARGGEDYIALIEAVGEAASRAASVEAALAAAVAQLCRRLGWPIGHVYLLHESGGLAPTEHWHLEDPERFRHFRRVTGRRALREGEGLPGRVLAHGRALAAAVADLDDCPRRAEAIAAGLRCGLSFPVVSDERVIAVAECYSPDPLPPAGRLLDVAAHLGRQVGRRAASLHVEAALRDSEDRFRSVAESATDAIIVADQDGRIVSWNGAAEQMFGSSEAEMIGEPLSRIMPERFRARHDAGLARIVEHGAGASRAIGTTFEVAALRRDGREFPIELSLGTWTRGDERYFSGIIRDVSARKRAEQQVRALESAPDPIVKLDARRQILIANARTEQLFGYARDEIVGRPVEELFSAQSGGRLAGRIEAIRAAAIDDSGASLELTGRRSDGSEFPADVTLRSVRGDDGAAVTGIIRDATERKRFERQLAHLADHDPLTELFNRRRFEEELSAYVAYTARFGGRGAVLLLDLDRFKYVNDTHGHRAGDDVIRAIGQVVGAHVRDTDVLARLGGDEFAVLLKHTDRAAAERRAREIIGAVRRPGDLRLALSASIGIALFGAGDQLPEDLLAAADLAMYAAKEAGGDRHHVFSGDDEHVVGIRSRQRCAEQIRQALDEGRFALYWQPIVDLATGAATHHELLLRMRGPAGEAIAPAAFIETAERFGLIREIDRWVVRRAIGLLARVEGMLEVNLSAASVGDGELPGLIERWIAEARADASRLIFEITETEAIANMEHARAFAERVGRLGCRFALDDFGAGFSSFHYLKRLPLDYLKIDGEFIRSLAVSMPDQLIVKSMVDIARGLGMKTVAEFVEDAETLAMVRRHGVDYSQGYHHGRPVPVPDD